VSIDDHTTPISHTPNLYLTSKEKSERLHHLHSDKRACQQQIRRLQEVIDESILTDGVTLDEELNGDLLQLMKPIPKMFIHLTRKTPLNDCFGISNRLQTPLKTANLCAGIL